MAKGKKQPPPKYGLRRASTKKEAVPLVDFDYVHKLSEAEKLWLDQFAHEFYQARFPTRYKPFHETPESRRLIYAADNARRRDLWNHAARFPLTGADEDETRSPEDAIIEMIDKEKE